ncbi:Cytoplasmic threonine--tRNA ligase, partial [Lachnellula suecica]
MEVMEDIVAVELSGAPALPKFLESNTSGKTDFIAARALLYEQLKVVSDQELSQKPRDDIQILLPDGNIKTGIAWETTPVAIARSISKSLAQDSVVARVDGDLWDLERPLEKGCSLEFLGFRHPEGLEVFWRSSAFILGQAAEMKFGCHLGSRLPTEDPAGFYHDMGNMGGINIQESDWKPLEHLATQAIRAKHPFERLVVSKVDLLEMFKYNKYKLYFIQDSIPDGKSGTVYRCGSLIDFSIGPHIPHTGRVKAFAILRNSSSYWLGDASKETLQRIAAISFPEKKLLEEHKKFLKEAEERSHRVIGTAQKLFFFNDVSPGSCFFLPHGTRIYNALSTLLREQYHQHDYEEVITPNIYKSELWKTSGHWGHYKENMFTFELDNDQFGLKPMNCPGHCIIFANSALTYRNLPLRYADFGVVHRNEFSGALKGLFRVRRFQQDDAHIFCTEEQIEDEITGIFDLMHSIYTLFGCTFKLKLSTRPPKFLGEQSTWDEAERKLTSSLITFCAATGAVWELNPGDGAFYGPKIDIDMFDALHRSHQCGTIQLDFQLPAQFALHYTSKDGGTRQPVMIHRAILGSFERMIAILTEHFAGKWPLWLSPRQVLVVPVSPATNGYAKEVAACFKKVGMYADVDEGGNTLGKKIRRGQMEAWNFTFVVGPEEQTSRTVNIRNRDDPTTQAKGRLVPLLEAVEKLRGARDEREL